MFSAQCGVKADHDLWINEIHYDNNGTDTNERIEIAGTRSSSLEGWSIVAYNGTDGRSYAQIGLRGVIPSQQNGYGTRSFAFPGLQNGSPDGIALVAPSGKVMQFLSYEGSFTAIDGPAAGRASTDIGVTESATSSPGLSLQLGGTGHAYAAFTWQNSLAGARARLGQRQPDVPVGARARALHLRRCRSGNRGSHWPRLVGLAWQRTCSPTRSAGPRRGSEGNLAKHEHARGTNPRGDGAWIRLLATCAMRAVRPLPVQPFASWSTNPWPECRARALTRRVTSNCSACRSTASPCSPKPRATALPSSATSTWKQRRTITS